MRIADWAVFARYSQKAIITLYPATPLDSVDGEDQQTVNTFSDIFDTIFDNLRHQEQEFRKLKMDVQSSNSKISSLQITISIIMGQVRQFELKITNLMSEKNETGLTEREA